MISKNVEKLSTGYRINRAGDDASGLVISNQLRAQVSGLKQAVRNAQDGISVLQTAEGALDQLSSMLNRMRDLTVQAANSGTNSSAAKQASQSEINALATEINRIAATTKFGALNLLDGSFGVTAATAGTTLSNLADQYSTGAGVITINITGGTAVTVAVAAQTNQNGATTAASLQTAIRNALAASTNTMNKYYSDKVNISSTTTVTGSKLNVTVGGFDAAGDTFTLADTAGTPLASLGFSTTVVAATGSGGIFQVGANSRNVNANEQIGIVFQNFSASSLGIGSLDVTTDAGSTAALDALDVAISTVSGKRGDIGAMQNRFDSLINNLNTTVENLSASESRIRDTDMASEMVEFTKNQVLSQAGTAMLAQANQIPQGILSLLKG
ncbi:MAG: flagellin [Actinomycetota bacterium]